MTAGAIIKVCGITSLEDAHEACQAGATALGFNFYRQSPRWISTEAARDIAASLPASVLKVGVFVQATGAEMGRVLREAGLNVAQIHGLPGGLQGGLQGGLPGNGGIRGNSNGGEDGAPERLWRAVSVDAEFRPDELERYQAEAVMLDSPSAGFGGSGLTFDWGRVRDVGVRIIVAGGLDGENVGTAIRMLRPWGVDACSRLEQAPGKKDPEKMRRFVEAARSAFASP